MNPIIILVVAIVIISAVVGAIAQFINKLNEVNAPPPRRQGPGGARQPDRDMDRFLAEIDRLRKKNAQQQADGQNPDETAAPPAARPVRPPEKERPPERQPDRSRERDRGRPRVVAELAEQPQARPPRREATDNQGFVTKLDRREKTDAQGFVTVPERREATDAQGFTAAYAQAPSSITSRDQGPVEELPVATVVSATSATGAPATRVTTLPTRARPVPKTDLARNLTGLLNSGQGVAMAVILQEILGPPKAARKASGPV